VGRGALKSDICILAEGSYPYYAGGVAQWVHELITEHKERTFYVVTLMPPHPKLTFHYTFPPNVIGHKVFVVQDLPEGYPAKQTPKETWDIVGKCIKDLMSSKDFEDFGPVIAYFEKYRKILGKAILCESLEAWNFLISLYKEVIQSGPFKDFFSTTYVLSRSLYSILLPELPEAKLYHALCTGYAGFLLFRAKQEKKAPCILTEQGVYTNERRIEIAMADWIGDMSSLNLALEDKKSGLKDFWVNAFSSFAHVCYLSCDEIISTFDGNQEIQLEGGADKNKLRTVVHGINPEEYAAIKHQYKTHPRTIAFIGRIVPIKDVKTFIRACRIIKDALPDIRIYVLGPGNEDPDYYKECLKLTEYLGLEDEIIFMGKVNIKEYLSEIDLVILTSISEAQPLVILEAGSIGIPFVATNVGACSQLCFGRENEDPPLGEAGIMTPLANPDATASAVIQLLTDDGFYEKCSQSIQKRIQTYYRFDQQHEHYRKLYHKYIT
jgi:glycosyltransferase involved in cell wall biosynthesis